MNKSYIDKLMLRFPCLETQREQIISAVDILVQMHKQGGKLLVAGNGGSSADSEHVCGELLKGFISKRGISLDKRLKLSKYLNSEDIDRLQEGISAIPLTSLTSAITAYNNDESSVLSLSQLALALGKEKDVCLAISTSGNSQNVLKCASVAKALGLKVIALTGNGGGKIKEIADISIISPEKETYLIQEHHLPIYHAICAQVEKELFEN